MVLVALLVATCGGGSPTGPSVGQAGGEQVQAGGNAGGSQGLGNCPTPGNPTKTSICHLPPGNPANAHQVCIDADAVPAHLEHGDYLGECVECAPADPYCCSPGDPYCRPGRR